MVLRGFRSFHVLVTTHFEIREGARTEIVNTCGGTV